MRIKYNSYKLPFIVVLIRGSTPVVSPDFELSHCDPETEKKRSLPGTPQKKKILSHCINYYHYCCCIEKTATNYFGNFITIFHAVRRNIYWTIFPWKSYGIFCCHSNQNEYLEQVKITSVKENDGPCLLYTGPRYVR